MMNEAAVLMTELFLVTELQGPVLSASAVSNGEMSLRWIYNLQANNKQSMFVAEKSTRFC